MTDLYAILGVVPDASTEDLHRAFRKKAKMLHPDVEGGDKAAFQEVARAFGILRDSEKRTAYDRDGTVNFQAENLHVEALRLVQAEVGGFLAAVSQQDGHASIVHADVIGLVVAAFDEKITAIEGLVERMRRDIVRFSEFGERFTTEDGTPNVIRKMIDAKIRGIEEAIPKAEADLITHRAARGIVADHTFRADPMPAAQFQIDTALGSIIPISLGRLGGLGGGFQ